MRQYKREDFFRDDVPVSVFWASGSHRESISYHSHDFMELVFVASGSTIHRVRFSKEHEVSYSLVTGDVFTILPGEAHAYTDSRNVHYCNVVFDFNYVADSLSGLAGLVSYKALFASDCVRNKFHLLLHERTTLEKQLRLIANELSNRKAGYAELVKAALTESLILILRHNPVDSVGDFNCNYSGIAHSIAIMENAPEEKHSVPELARMAAMSESSFYARFREITGVTPNEYLMNLRLANACNLLMDKELSISEIAARCGFYDSNYFIRLFKKKQGVTPGLFRRQFPG